MEYALQTALGSLSPEEDAFPRTLQGGLSRQLRSCYLPCVASPTALRQGLLRLQCTLESPKELLEMQPQSDALQLKWQRDRLAPAL